MTDQSRLAAALHKCCWQIHSGAEPLAASLLRADPTLICPDPADHELADAMERLPGDTDISLLRLDTDYGPHWYVRFHRRKGTGPTLEAAIAAALEDKP